MPWLLPTLELVVAAVAVAAAYVGRFGVSSEGSALVLAAVLPLGWLAAAAAHRAYDGRFVGSGAIEFRRLGRASVTFVAGTGLVAFAADLDGARGFLLLALPLAVTCVLGLRMLARTQVARRRRGGRAMNRLLLVGRAASLPGVVAAVRRDPAAGLEVVGACLPHDEANDAALRNALAGLGVPVLGDVGDVREVAIRYAAEGVAVVAGDVHGNTIRSIGWALEDLGVELLVSSGVADMAAERVTVQAVGGVPLLRIAAPRFGGAGQVAKTVFDRLAAAVAIVLLAPLLAALALLVRCTSRGPALYLQERVGRNGTHFRMVKFRSMHTDAEARLAELTARNVGAGPLFKMPDDPRVTRVGRWLRRFSLDELPQLFNVVTGSMSLVGPRPPLPGEVERYEGHVRRRLLVKPGLTGLWQVSGRSDLSWEDSVRLDLHYVENWSLALDLQLLARTARVVVSAKGAY